jgi:Phage tail tube protein
MAQGESNRVGLRVSKETTWNETPSSPTMARLPYLNETLTHSKRTKQSDVLRSDRMKDAQVQVGYSGEGDINFELRFSDFDTLLEVALASTYSAATTTGAGSPGNLQFAVSGGGTQVITGPAAWTTNYVVGAWVRVKLATNGPNNGVFKITAKTSTTLTVANASGTAENSSVAVVSQKTMRNGTTKQSVLIEKQYEDLTTNYINYRGMRVAGLSLNIQTEEIVTGTFRFMGSRGNIATATVSGGFTGPSTNNSMTASLNVGSIVEGGASLTTAIKSITLDLNNNVRALMGVGQAGAIGINMGSIGLTGRVEAYFEDQALYTKVVNHTSSSLEFRFTDEALNVMVITLAQLRFSGNPQNPGIDQDVMLPLEYSCERQPTDSYMIQIDSLAV